MADQAVVEVKLRVKLEPIEFAGDTPENAAAEMLEAWGCGDVTIIDAEVLWEPPVDNDAVT